LLQLRLRVTTPRSLQIAIEADGLAPPDTGESAIRMLLPPGAYTAILSDANGASGTGLVAVYRP
jgi:hypothetical protein